METVPTPDSKQNDLKRKYWDGNTDRAMRVRVGRWLETRLLVCVVGCR